MDSNTSTLMLAAILTALACVPAGAQQTTGTPGSPGATTIDGRYLPSPLQPFRGQIDPNAAQSKPYWSALTAPPKGAPNVLAKLTSKAPPEIAPPETAAAASVTEQLCSKSLFFS